MGDDKVTQPVDSVYWIWFQLLFGTGTRRAELFMNYFDNPKLIYDGIENKNRVFGMLTEEEQAASATAFSRAAEIKRRTLNKGVDIITPDCGEYPELLRHIYSKPAVLYVKGDLGCLRDRLAIAMVGSRKHTEYGKDVSAWFARGLARGGAIVVSGLAHGIDTECHMVALNAGGKSIGVLGCGIDIDYPKGNASVKRLLCENGAVVTEFPLGTQPAAFNFPTRNRIVSGMCHGVVVVEADISSGSLITAQHALDQGRDIFAVPGSIFSMRAKGAHRLIRDGAKLTECPQDIFDEYEHLGLWQNVSGEYNPADGGAESYSQKPPMKDDADENRVDTATEPRNPPQSGDTNAKALAAPQPEPDKKTEKRPLSDDASEEARAVYAVIDGGAMTVNQIAEIAGADVSKVLSALTELEIYGLIQGYPGRKFAVCPSGGKD